MNGKATKKPVIIDFFEWENQDGVMPLNELTEWVEDFGDDFGDHFNTNFENLTVKTLEGTSYNVPDGYVIIRGVANEYYPCERKIFDLTYNIN